MLPLTPPPPPPAPRTPPPQKKTVLSPLNQIVISKQSTNRLTLEAPYSYKKQPTEQAILRSPRKTNLAVWCGAIICLIFSLLLIFFGIATLIIFLAIKPRTPVFDTSAASLNVIYLNYPEFLNGDLTILANFSNPNRKLDVRFEYLDIELYFSDSLIATQALQPFTQRRRETRSLPVHLISSLVYLPPNLALELQKQVQSNRVVYNIRGTFKVRVSMGPIHFSYWLHGRCQLEMTSPPSGILIAHSCRTKR